MAVIAALLWDGAPAHRAGMVRDARVLLVTQPPAAPELNPAQRVILEWWAILKGLVYATLAEKSATVERELVASAADPERVRGLVGWAWISDTLKQLPPENPSSS